MEVIDLSSRNQNIDLKNIQNKDISPKKEPDFESEPIDNNELDISPPAITLEEIMSPEELQKNSENQIEKRKQILYLENLIKAFPIKLAEYNLMNFNKYPLAELQNIEIDLKRKLNSGGSYADLAVIGYIKGLQAIESIGPYLKLELDGLSSLASTNQDVIDCVKLLGLEYTRNMTEAKPEYRLAYMTGLMCFSVHTKNKKKKNDNLLNEFLEKPINVEKIKDL